MAATSGDCLPAGGRVCRQRHKRQELGNRMGFVASALEVDPLRTSAGTSKIFEEGTGL